MLCNYLRNKELLLCFVHKNVQNEFCKQAKRKRNTPITPLEMVSFAFHFEAKRGRNASETRNAAFSPNRAPTSSHWLMFALQFPILYHSPIP